MITFLRFGPLFLGTVILVIASLGWSFWFFYSFLNNGDSDQILVGLFGRQLPVIPMAAGCVGCGAQLFVYSFAANLGHIKDHFFKWLLICVSSTTIGLSMFSTYSTLTSFLEAKSQTVTRSEFVSSQKLRIIESRNSDLNTNSAAAEQAISDKYRTQSKALTESNEALRQRQLEELDRLADEETPRASPLDGLIRVAGKEGLVSALFCAWLAITFDLLPILGISLLSRLSLDRKINQEALSHGGTASQYVYEMPITQTSSPVQTERGPTDASKPVNVEERLAESAPRAPHEHLASANKIHFQYETHSGSTRSMGENTQTDEKSVPNRAIQEILDKKPVFLDLSSEFQKTPIGDVPTDILYPIITKYLSEGAVPLSYAGVADFTGLSKWKVQQYFTKAVEEGFLVNKTQKNVDAGYEFSKTIRYHIKRNIDLEAVINDCQRW